MRGIPVSSCTRMSPVDTASAMYSKCMVSPFMRTPMAMMASKGAVEEVFGVSETEREVRSVVEAPSRSPAERVEVCVLWIWEAEKSLFRFISCLSVVAHPLSRRLTRGCGCGCVKGGRRTSSTQ